MGLWTLTSAEAQGLSHKRRNLPCQDKTFCLENNRVRVIALADGAGSARLSHFGAESVTRHIAHYLTDNFDTLYAVTKDNIQQKIADELRCTLDALAEHLKCNVTDLSSTLLVVAVKKRKYIALHIGDGVIGCYNHGELVTLSEPKNGEFAHITWFTTTTNLEKEIRVYKGDATTISGFILMSDGVEPSLYNGQNAQLADAVISLFYSNAKYNRQEMQKMLEESLREVIAMRTHDDCSIALLSRTRFKNYDEYAKYRKKVVKRNKKAEIAE